MARTDNDGGGIGLHQQGQRARITWRDIWRDLSTVQVGSPLRRTLNTGLARFLLLIIAASAIFVPFLWFYDSQASAIFSLAVVIPITLAWLLNRRGNQEGSVLAVGTMLCAVGVMINFPADAMDTDSGVNVLCTLPILLAAIFLSQRAAYSTFLFLFSIIAVRLSVAHVPYHQAIRYLTLALTNVGVFTVLSAYGSGILHRLLADLERQVEARTKALGEALAEAERLNSLRQSMLADLGHDLANKAQVITGNAQMLIFDYEDTHGDGRSASELPLGALMNRLLATTEQLGSYGRDLRDLALLERGTLEVKLKPTDMAAVLQQIAEEWRTVLQGKEIAFDFIRPAEIPMVETDSWILRRVVENLLNNAMKFRRPGVPDARVALQVTVSMDRSRVALAIADSGIGIAAEDLPKLGRQRVRLREADVEGTGIGIPFCVAAMQQLSGSLTITSPGLNQGTTVTITLPTVPGADQRDGSFGQ